MKRCAGMGAALVDGFVTPRVADLAAGLGAADLSITGQLLHLCILFNQALARLGAIAMSAAIIAWSVDLLRRAGLERALGAAGIAIGLGCVAALIAGVLQLDVHGMMRVLVLQAAWTIGLGVLLIHHPMP